jgi:hypothetical protein
MKQALRDLLTSKRVIVALVGAAADIAIHYGIELTPEELSHFEHAILTVTGILIGGFTLTDTGKALGKPAGVGHRN